MTRRYIVTGFVQGVGFRIFVRDAASRLRLQGEVWNCADGSVECIAKGPEPGLDEFESALALGPGRVAQVRSFEAPDYTGPVGFHVGPTRR